MIAIREIICEKIMRKPATEKTRTKEELAAQEKPVEPEEFYRKAVEKPSVRELLKRLAKK